MIWNNILMVIALGKAVVVGATAGLALLGAMDIALAASASQWMTEFQTTYFDTFAIAGGAVGFAGQLYSIIFR
jgi:hypothetical protein